MRVAVSSEGTPKIVDFANLVCVAILIVSIAKIISIFYIFLTGINAKINFTKRWKLHRFLNLLEVPKWRSRQNNAAPRAPC